MKHSKIFLGATTCILAVAALAAKKAQFTVTRELYTTNCYNTQSQGTTVHNSSSSVIGYTDVGHASSGCSSKHKLYNEEQ
jgi:hypothetical protein